jgi:hypothetical protein
MGNAFTAVADDDQAIFYNPAGLAGVKDFTLNVASISLEASNDLLTGAGDLTGSLSGGLGSLNALMGKNYYVRGQGYSSLVIPGLGVAALYDQQISASLKNLAIPTGTLGVQTTYGVQVGFGKSLNGKRKAKWDVRIGAAAKFLTRSGGYQTLSLTDLLTLDTSSLTRSLSESGSGIGFDLGAQYVYTFKKRFTFMGGAVFKDVGDTTFSTGSAPIRSNMVLGVAGTYQYSDLKATLSYDYSNLLNSMDWRKKSHLGLELKFPLISLYSGLNQIYPTYGASVDLWLIKVMYLSYAEEQATLVNQDASRRSMVQITIKLHL